MFNLLKSIIVLLCELNIYQCFGYAMSQMKYIPDANTFLQKSIYGFIGYHVLFWCISFPCTLTGQGLNRLTLLWLFFICALLLMVWIRYFRQLMKMYRDVISTVWKYKVFFVPCVIMGIVVTYYICINGQIDIDARTYIGEVTSMVDTGKLAGISVTSGMETQLLDLKRSFSMFGANSAVLCRIFNIHPLVFCRTTRATINILFFTGTALELFRWVFRSRKNTLIHALMCTMLTLGILFSFANTAYTEARFLLYRAYEGKAYCASSLVLITILIAIKLCNSADMRYYIIFFMDMLAGMSISASATFILPLAGGSIILAYMLIAKKWLYIPALFFAVLPNLIYIFLSLSGFAGFSLEG